MKQITVAQYATLRGISETAVRQAILRKNHMPGVLSTQKFGKVHVLNFDQRLYNKWIKTEGKK